jgi:hypothetical protein
MFAAVLVATLAPAQPPAPLPDRWLLRLAPADLPRTPPDLYSQSWFDALYSRASSRSWERWVQFRPADRRGPATVTVTKIGGSELFRPPNQAEPVTRTLPLAVHGPLVEFDRQLYTAVSRPLRGGMKASITQQLHLGAAVELKDRVWYQAGTHTSPDGKTVTVEEWRLEFKDDPRTADAGSVAVRGFRRPLTERTGKEFAAEVRFTAKPPDDLTSVRVVTFHPPNEAALGGLTYLQLGNDRGAPDVIWVEGGTPGWDRLSLTPASRPAPVRLEPDAPGLVQPPVK